MTGPRPHRYTLADAEKWRDFLADPTREVSFKERFNGLSTNDARTLAARFGVIIPAAVPRHSGYLRRR